MNVRVFDNGPIVSRELTINTPIAWHLPESQGTKIRVTYLKNGAEEAVYTDFDKDRFQYSLPENVHPGRIKSIELV